MRRLLLSFLSLALLTAGCGSKSVRFELEAASVRGRPAIVFVPGFYGTALADAKTGERLFLTAGKALWSRVPLALTAPDLGVPGARRLRTDGVLEYVRVIPGLYSTNVYGEALEFLRGEFGKEAEIVPYEYDWRDDISKAAAGLDALVHDLQRAGATSISLVGHSMGGLVVSWYLRYGAQEPETATDDGRGARNIRAVVLAGAPFGGSAVAFRNLQIGTTLGGATVPLGQLSLSTFPAMYQLMPAPDVAALVDGELAPARESIYAPELWRRHRWGLYRDADATGEIAVKRADAATRYLQRAETIWRKLRGNGGSREAHETPVLVLVGRGQRTLARVAWTGGTLSAAGHLIFSDDGMKKAFPGRNAPSLFDDGDGSVTTTSATPPPGLLRRFSMQLVATDVPHEEMFGHRPLLGEMTAHLRRYGVLRVKPGLATE